MLLFIILTVFSGVVIDHLLIQSDLGAAYINSPLHNRVFSLSKRFFTSNTAFNNSYTNGNGYSNTTNTTNPQFTYKAVVAYQPKDRNDQIYQKLKDSILSPTGEDNYFITSNSISDVYAAVADGVGGWAELGYDSSAISRELCNSMSKFTSTLSGRKDGISPRDILDFAYNKIKEEGVVKVGSTTAIVAHFKDNGLLEVANLGDSWCGVFRDSKLVFETKFQTVGFNAPYQLSIIPDSISKGQKYIQNTPADADNYSFQLQKNDVILLATDGVTDNIGTEDMELFLKDNEDQILQDLESVSKDFVSKVVSLSKDPEYPSVFAQELSKLTGKTYGGGKQDDITVVVVKAM
ncbi:hypothetical protein KAFR_0D04720 [Kazachstania africana CBS 2517]|uniref:Protein phosphatase n=1 Tax=Kazachstania africana (strain ATCC 22294 / BCRC 22015 / CBS 2517 / CECT 1963 / NBRC 1671 / NRRL Y-8276) TaxID=1071382 RepID=H2AUS0_KAZAF|nr:hypothetical protein KAFR_0D04720 [Kazachstania africana CBS 2517]CCF58120.1 hypothetical protein KAFR_0D04720 [Kazachstania africana CBS 2517]